MGEKSLGRLIYFTRFYTIVRYHQKNVLES
jgi:hypothetical protein